MQHGAAANGTTTTNGGCHNLRVTRTTMIPVPVTATVGDPTWRGSRRGTLTGDASLRVYLSSLSILAGVSDKNEARPARLVAKGVTNTSDEDVVVQFPPHCLGSVIHNTHLKTHTPLKTYMGMIPVATQGVRRVVVTGIGAVTPLGNSFVDSWTALLQGQSGVTMLEEAMSLSSSNGGWSEDDWQLARQLPSQVAAPVRRNVQGDSRTARFVQLAIIAARESLQQARLLQAPLEPDDDNPDSNTDLAAPQLGCDPERAGVSIGCSLPNPRELFESTRLVEGGQLRKLSPHFVPKVLVNSASARVSMAFGCQGPNQSATTACAAGSQALADAYGSILMNQADVMLAGGTEATIDPLTMGGFCRLRALSTGLATSEASRPFDRQRNGFVMGEGSAILVLEELQHALQRNAPILGELCGYGLSADAHHITSPHPNGLGAERAMALALRHAGLENHKHFVGYVNAHATSTPKGDEIEAQAIDRLFSTREDDDAKSRTQPLRVSSTKGATGHLLGAAGALEAAFTVQALADQCLPPTLNLHEPNEAPASFEYVRQLPHVINRDNGDDGLEVALNNSFGFGGVNACLVFRRWTGI